VLPVELITALVLQKQLQRRVISVLPAGTVLNLENEKWTVVGPLPGSDTGGYGVVCLVTGERSGEAVAKLVRKDPRARRELLVGDSVAAAGYTNVIRILDKGEHVDHWVIVMPRADKSLAKHLEQLDRPLSEDEALTILHDVAAALADIAGEIVHRDLKPRNILLLNGTWCLSDFGLAKYEEATTSTETWKYSKTKPYAAPEQWREQTATSKTDVYAFGVTAYQLLTGTRPFPGPDFREQHLKDPVPTLTAGPPQLRALVRQCLMKSPQARPSAAEILRRLEKITPGAAPSASLAALAAANETAVNEMAAEQQQASAEQELAEERELLHRSAVELFEPISSQLIEKIETYADQANIEIGTRGKRFIATLRGARIGLDNPARSPRRGNTPFDVISESVITVDNAQTVHGYRARSHSLWYCDGQREGQFAWYEVAFSDYMRVGQVDPYALSAWQTPPVAFNHVMGTTRVDWFQEIDLGDLDEFVDRWLEWFGRSVTGQLQRPSGSGKRQLWRRSGA
jgi:eukaryotic-like serine/threonine-protein kinase